MVTSSSTRPRYAPDGSALVYNPDGSLNAYQRAAGRGSPDAFQGPPGPVYDRWWEEQAQALVRAMKPPLPEDQRLLLAWETEDGAEVLYGGVHYLLAQDFAEIRVLAVHVAHHREGIGRALLRAALDDIEDQRPGAVVIARTWVEDVAAASLLADAGFSPEENYRGWVRHVRLFEAAATAAGSPARGE